MMWLLRDGILVIMIATTSGALGGDLPGAQFSQVGHDVQARLSHVDEFLKGKQWEDAVETLRRVMENQGDQLIRTKSDPRWESLGFSRFIPLREYCQQQLASWHRLAPEALALYRRQVDSLAENWYRQSIDEASVGGEESEAKLRRVVDQLMISSEGDTALLRLGDLALERADYTLARRCWLRISPKLGVPRVAAELLGVPAGSSWWLALRERDLGKVWPPLDEALKQPDPNAVGTTWLAYPDSDIPLAAVWARLILASLLEGARERADLELACLRHWYPKASGSLAGREGSYETLLADVLQEATTWSNAAEPTGWTTLGGCMARNKRLSQPIDIALQPLWRSSLTGLQVPNEGLSAEGSRVSERGKLLLSYHVAVENGVVFVHEPGLLRALELKTGKPVWPLSKMGPAGMAREGEIFAWTRQPVDAVPKRRVVAGVPRYCVTVDRGRLFACMGSPWTDPGDVANASDQQRSFLVGIDLSTRKLLFDRIIPDQPGWQFEAAPVADVSHVYISMRRRDPVSSQWRVACYRIATGRRVWETDVARAASANGLRVEITHCPLSLRNGMLYCHTNLGVVAALRASDGRIGWLCSYRRVGPSGSDANGDDRHLFRDLTPCLLYRDRVIAAPSDSDRIFAFDAGSGHVIWTTPAEQAVDAVHLLGVGHDHLLASGDALYWIDVATGAVVGRFPTWGKSGHGYASPTPCGYGRGILAGEFVYWPTHDEIYVFDQRVPRMVRQPIPLTVMGIRGGNLVADDGVLLIASGDQLVALGQPGWAERKEANPKRRK